MIRGALALATALAIAAAPPALAARHGAFRTPSHNIVCGWYAGTGHSPAVIECGIRSGLKPTPRRVHCRVTDPVDDRVSLTATGRTMPVTCAGDPGPFVFASSAKVLGYGKRWSAAGFTCTSRRTGLTCRNRRGHGFFLSRQHWRRF